MDEPPKTRPPAIEAERQRDVVAMQRHVHDDYHWRMTLAEQIANIRADLRVGQSWMEIHDRRDDERFKSFESRFGPVVSGVNDYTETKQQWEGVKKFLGFAVLIVSTAGAAVMGTLQIIAWKGGP